MARTPTWYSIKNRLVAGEVKANNEWERFIAGLVTSYGCLDIWYQNIASESNVLECRIFYLQVDSAYVAAESWERTGERPKPWMQLKGTVAELRATLISLLPQLSQLHDTKRHGEWNLGATQPFEGQGSIVTRTNIGGTWYIVITGRFGDLLLNASGVELNWEDITWAFDGCDPTATGPDADLICIRAPGESLSNCNPTSDPVGTCLTGSCGDWSAVYGYTNSDCSGTWFDSVDYSDWTQKEWDTNQSCVDPTGTCVTGNCVSGFTSTTTTQAACTALGGNWQGSVIVNTNQGWIDSLGCLGCCKIGSDCDFPVVRAGMSSADCTTLAAGRTHTWTQNETAEMGCTLGDVLEDNNCTGDSSIPSTITVNVVYSITSGSHIGPGSVDDPSSFGGWPDGKLWWWYPCCDVDPGSPCGGYLDAVTPGTSHTAPRHHNNPAGTHTPAEDCERPLICSGPAFHLITNWTVTGYDYTEQVGFRSNISRTYVFERDLSSGDNPDNISYILTTGQGDTIEGIGYKSTSTAVHLEGDCGQLIDWDHWGTTNDLTFVDYLHSSSGVLERRITGTQGVYQYTGSILNPDAGNFGTIFLESTDDPHCSGARGGCGFNPFGDGPYWNAIEPTVANLGLCTTSVRPIGWSVKTPLSNADPLTTIWGRNSVADPGHAGTNYGFRYVLAIDIDSFKTVVTITES